MVFFFFESENDNAASAVRMSFFSITGFHCIDSVELLLFIVFECMNERI